MTTTFMTALFEYIILCTTTGAHGVCTFSSMSCVWSLYGNEGNFHCSFVCDNHAKEIVLGEKITMGRGCSSVG